MKPLQLQSKAWYTLVFTPLLVYVVFRAYSVGVTYDESWTLRWFVDLPFMQALNCSPCNANNHLLNTLLIKLMFVFGNDSLFAARIPNVLAFLLYGYFAFRVCSQYLSFRFGIIAFLIVLCNPFVLDFFSLARGYGLAMGFQMMSIYYFISFFKSLKTKHAIFSLISGVFAVLSSFSFLNYWLVIAFVILIYSIVFSSKFKLKQILGSVFLIALFLIALIYEPIRKMLINGNFYYGGDTGFFSDTLVSLTKYSMYSSNESPLVFGVLIGFLFVLFLSVILSYFKSKNVFDPKSLFLLVLVLCFFAIISQFYLFGTPFVIDRSALFFYPLFVFLLCFALYDLQKYWLSMVLAGAITLVVLVNFIFHANTYKTATWYFDAHTIGVLEFLNNEGKLKGEVIKLDYSWPFDSAIIYYTQRKKYEYLRLVKSPWNREVFNQEADYYLFLNQRLEKVGYEIEHQKIVGEHKKTIKVFDAEHVVLYSIPANE